jgi:hypothetical protein
LGATGSKRRTGRVVAEEYRRRHNLGSASSMQKALAALDKLDLVEPLDTSARRSAGDLR